ncbi:MAG: RNA-binding protein [Pseudolabrys sp.]
MLAIAQDGELDRGATSVAAATERTCALTREVRPISELVRFVVGPAGEAVPDVKRKLPGRGIWVTATRAAIAGAAERNVFTRGFRREVHVPRDLAAQTERLLERAALDALAIVGKAGAVVGGFSKVEAALGRDDILALIHAADAADNGKRKLADALERNTGGKRGGIAIIATFTGDQLDLALSRPNVVHAALLAGSESATFLARVARLTRFRTGFSPDAVSAHAPTDGAQGHSTE